MPNLKHALRTLFKTPFVTTVAALSLALGIGANAAIFSIFDEMLRRPLPVAEPDRLVNLSAPGVKSGSLSCGDAGACEDVFSYPMFRDLEREQSAFEGIAAHVPFGANLGYENQTVSQGGLFVSGSYFPLLGVQPVVGRLLANADDEVPGAHPLAVLDYDYWEERMGADPAVIGRVVTVNGQPMTIVGVVPRGFTGTTLGSKPAVYVPISMREVLIPGWEGLENRRSYWAYLFARLKPDVTLEQAETAINVPYRQIIQEVEVPLQSGMSEQNLTQFADKEVVVSEGQHGQSSIRAEAGTPILMLFTLTGIVLLIACANIANLLLARGASRAMEMSVRLSLGATRRHLLAQLLTESVLLALIGGLASVLFAYWTLAFITSLLPAEAVTTMRLALSWPAIWFTLGLALLTGLLFGLFPALHSTRSELVTTLRNNAGSVVTGRQAARFRNSLVVAQIALSMTLLTSAGLFIRSLSNISRVDLGVNVENLLTFGIIPVRNGYDNERALVLYERVQEELSAMPGVVGVTAATVPVIGGDTWGTSVSVEGFERTPETDAGSAYSLIGTDYFRTLDMPLLLGREFTRADSDGAPRVAIVNEEFARKFGLGRDVIGKRMATGRSDTLGIEIVGLVRNAKYSDVKDPVPPVFYRPYRQGDVSSGMNFLVRTAGDPEQMLQSIPPLIGRLDPDLPVEGLQTMPQQIRENVSLDRMIGIVSAAFAAIATLLASIGLYGVLAYSVAQRTREIGVRIALGAQTGRVRGLVLGQMGRMTLIGGVLGMLTASGIGYALRSQLYGLQGQDPVVLILSAVALSAVALAAAYVPARRATKVDPIRALRYE